jgi:hypothetical protein
MHDPSLGRFFAIDPLAAKYTSLSPYNFVANNPILFVDADGREIIIRDNANKNKQVLYHPTNEEIRAKALGAGASEFVIETYAALDKLASGYGSHYANIVNELIDDCYDVYIFKTTTFGDQSALFGPLNDPYYYEGSVFWNPFGGLIVGQPDENGNHYQSPAVGLGHELEHAFNHMLALADFHDFFYSKLEEGKKKKEIEKLSEFKDKKNKILSTITTTSHIEAEEEPTAKNEKTAGGAYRNFYFDVLGVFKAKCSTCTEVSTNISPKEQSDIDRANEKLNKN